MDGSLEDQAPVPTTPTAQDGLLSGFSTWTMAPDEAFRRVEAASALCPVAHSDLFDGFGIVMDYKNARRAASDWRGFSIEPSAFRPAPPRGLATPLDLDPPAQAEWRRIISLAVNARTPHELEAQVTADAHAAIDAFAGRGSCDLVPDYAAEIPLRALCHAIGVGSDHTEEFLNRSVALLGAGNDPMEFMRLYGEFRDVMVSMVHERNGSGGDDYLSQLNVLKMDGRPLTDEEIGIATVNLIPPGFHTTVSGLSSLLFEVLSRPELKDRLTTEPDDIPRVVDEALRLHPPIFGFYRRATGATQLEDVRLEPGDDVYLCWAAANRDPVEFANPLEFDAERPHVDKHLSFGWGVHKCPGAPLARAEMAVGLRTLLERLPDICVAIDSPEYAFSGMETMIMNTLPATFTAVRPH